ncbi:TetR family transcriptional regulator [Rhodococcus sp. C3V]|uniref:TetR/AcrR family transcriptional regulator n=1 Tax=Rhodococcus sp. C3V TaxID=3034165 RepID=UPI0023E2E289|nr:TetR family transcriptional regulator [Rhodococcus sp. C3V]MDF3320123.1 TetR family transcriptional regulator [Rhodococcus sp. C3V]
MTNVVRPYKGVAAETRRRQRRQQLLDACLDVVAESGVATITVETICNRANLSKRYFYESFRDRDTILVAALDEIFRPLGDKLAKQFEPHKSADDRVALTASTLVEILTADPRAAYLYISAAGNPALESRRRQIVDDFTPLLMREILNADPNNHKAIATTIVMVAGTTELLDRWLRGSLPFTRKEFIDTLQTIGLKLAHSD